MSDLTRPVLRWHGGKWLLAQWIIAFFPPHRIYVEPFGGAASVLLRKPRAYAEVYNDLDEQVVTLFRVLQDVGLAAELHRILRVTPFARAEFERAWELSPNDPVETARRLIMRSFMGFGSNSHSDVGRGHKTTGFRADSNRSGSTPAHDWAGYPNALEAFTERLRGVVIERRPAVQVMQTHARDEALTYLDPPYVHSTRLMGNKHDPKHRYRHEMNEDQHSELLKAALALPGMVVISGYHTRLYDQALKGWARFERQALPDGARPRVEVLWLNPLCADRLTEQRAQFDLFEEA